MDTILKVLRMQRMRMCLPSVVSTLFLSLLLTACGGGSGPGDESEGSIKNAATSSNAVRNDFLSGDSKNIFLETESNSGQLCQQENVLLCEDFEWSSSLDFIASNTDWSLKGWQYSGLQNSGNFCNMQGEDNNQCALVFAQAVSSIAANDSIVQKASYNFSEYAASEKYIVVKWRARWSQDWRWDTRISPVLSLNFLNSQQESSSVITLQIKNNAVPEIVVNSDYTCGFERNIWQADSRAVSQRIKTNKWRNFKLVFDAVTSVNRLRVELSLDDNVIVAVEQDVSCRVNQAEVNSIVFLSNSRAENNTALQSVAIDNVLLTY